MKTHRNIFKLVLVIMMLLVLPLTGYTEETQPTEEVQQDTSVQQQEQPSQQSKDESKPVDQLNDTPKTGGSDAFDKGVAKMVTKAKEIENNTVALAQAYSFPLLKYSLICGAILLLLGIFLSVLHKKMGDSVRGVGIWLMFGGITAFVLMNFSPNIGEKIISFVQWVIN